MPRIANTAAESQGSLFPALAQRPCIALISAPHGEHALALVL